MNKTLEISVELGRQVLPCLEGRLEVAQAERAQLDDEITHLRTALAELKAKLNGELPLANGQALRQRKPKGYADNAIESLLKSLAPGPGLTMAQITQRTGLNHSSVFRTLKESKRNKGRFVEHENTWRFKT